ncbi:MAG: histidine phosphotransferase family protein, partial [Pseudomonadota bacterium]
DGLASRALGFVHATRTPMTAKAQPTDLELAALISSKICHDVIGPVGAINNGLEILDEEGDRDAQAYALEVIRNVTKRASARLQFARFAFGASGSAGSAIDLDMARYLALAFVDDGKHTLTWTAASGLMAKDQVKLLLNLVASAVTALPRGGTIQATVHGDLSAPRFVLVCAGRGARKPNFLTDLVEDQPIEDIDSMSIQAYYTWRLAELAEMDLAISESDAGITIEATEKRATVAA